MYRHSKNVWLNPSHDIDIPSKAAIKVSSQSASTLLRIPQSPVNFGTFDFDSLVHQRRKRVIRPQKMIIAAILDACRTPSVQHWIMVKARLGYDTFWKHMDELVAHGMMNTLNDGSKTLYSINEKGLNLLRELQNSQQ